MHSILLIEIIEQNCTYIIVAKAAVSCYVQNWNKSILKHWQHKHTIFEM